VRSDSFQSSCILSESLITKLLSRKLSDSESAIEISHTQDILRRSTVMRNDTPPTTSDDGVLKSCPGYDLAFPQGQSPYTSYPFAIHTLRILPWMILLDGQTMILMSDDCTRLATFNDNSPESPLPCISCRSLHNHPVIMGIRHRALDGAHENTPWTFLGIIQLVHLLDQKNQQIEGLRLRGLNAGRALAFRDRCLDGWKRFAVAIGNNNMPRLHVLVNVELRNGAGIFGLLSKIDQASSSNYRPRGYEEADFQRAFLLWKLGGRSAANIAHRTLGCPSIDSARRHVRTKPLSTSPGIPTLAEISNNLAIGFENLPHNSTRVVGMTMPVDEIKIQECLRWDSRTNMILGICREHGSKCSLEFRTIAQADFVVDCLNEGKVHFAAEVSAI
jgi:hypothetical protein